MMAVMTVMKYSALGDSGSGIRRGHLFFGAELPSSRFFSSPQLPLSTTLPSLSVTYLFLHLLA